MPAFQDFLVIILQPTIFKGEKECLWIFGLKAHLSVVWNILIEGILLLVLLERRLPLPSCSSNTLAKQVSLCLSNFFFLRKQSIYFFCLKKKVLIANPLNKERFGGEKPDS